MAAMMQANPLAGVMSEGGAETRITADVSATSSEISGEKDMLNMGKVSYCRTLTAVTAGLASGTLGLQGLQGVIAYAAVTLVTSLVLLAKAQFKPSDYFRAPVHAILFSNAFDRSTIVPFLLFWTLAYTIAHIY
eukprot:Plantae.Rhodophyta-Purpureofilum_apyrenoidigerum.ctg42460.p2 GENE.Plantae.Rhodophyta-Purpureofilum_apyrenoidigerum.ctg42460~~Plantae.Rhodophyta-Purpureofilum_apyrenoidigerum.ctg42460.p2  ORF type:complete len:134 (-),score=22.19 Plantae.Rhodophyta-Purpureofilum_apyrenoidigerum.ctg42460:12-413(-)